MRKFRAEILFIGGMLSVLLIVFVFCLIIAFVPIKVWYPYVSYRLSSDEIRLGESVSVTILVSPEGRKSVRIREDLADVFRVAWGVQEVATVKGSTRRLNLPAEFTLTCVFLECKETQVKLWFPEIGQELVLGKRDGTDSGKLKLEFSVMVESWGRVRKVYSFNGIGGYEMRIICNRDDGIDDPGG